MNSSGRSLSHTQQQGRREVNASDQRFCVSELFFCWGDSEEGPFAGYREFGECGLAATCATYDPSCDALADRIFLATRSYVANAIQRDVHVGKRT
jgi:hypothetical protein